jgi:hypothetical protein
MERLHFQCWRMLCARKEIRFWCRDLPPDFANLQLLEDKQSWEGRTVMSLS